MVWWPGSVRAGYDPPGGSRAGRRYPTPSRSKLRDDASRRLGEFRQFLKLGRTLVMVVPSEAEQLSSLQSAAKRLARAQDKVAELEAELTRLRERKALFSGSGLGLEAAVEDALGALGFDVEQGSMGRTDRVVTSTAVRRSSRSRASTRARPKSMPPSSRSG